MEVVVESITRVSLAMEGRALKRSWIPTLVDIDGKQYAKVTPSDYTLASLFGEFTDTENKSRPTLANSAAFKELLQERDRQDKAGDAPSSKLFQRAGQRDGGTKKRKHSAAEVKDMRQNPKVFELTLALRDGTELPLVVVRPAHTTDILTILCDKTNVTNFFKFMNDKGVQPEELWDKRGYRTSGSVGVWTRKSGKRYRRVSDESKQCGYREEALDDAVDGGEQSPSDLPPPITDDLPPPITDGGKVVMP